MTERARSECEVLERFASHSELLRRILKVWRDESAPEPPLAYVVIADFAEQSCRDGVIDAALMQALLEETEYFMEKDGPAADLVAAGFLETLMNRASSGQIRFHELAPWLLPKSLEYCKAWDEFTGCCTTAAASETNVS